MTPPIHSYNTRSKGKDPIIQTLQAGMRSTDPEVQWLASDALAALKANSPSEKALRDTQCTNRFTWCQNHYVALTTGGGVIGLLACLAKDQIKATWSHYMWYKGYTSANQAIFGSDPEKTCDSWSWLGKHVCLYGHANTSLREQAHWDFFIGYCNWALLTGTLLGGCIGVRYLYRRITK